MKVREVLEITDENTTVAVHVRKFGMKFTASHFPNYMLDKADSTLLDAEVGDMYVQDEELHIVPNI